MNKANDYLNYRTLSPLPQKVLEEIVVEANLVVKANDTTEKPINKNKETEVKGEQNHKEQTHKEQAQKKFTPKEISKITNTQKEPHKNKKQNVFGTTFGILLLVGVIVAGIFIFSPMLGTGKNVLMDVIWGHSNIFGNDAIPKEKIYSITLKDSLKNVPKDAWDVSEEQNGTVKAWVEERTDGMYDLYLGARGKIIAPKDCTYLFGGYTELKKIDFGDVLDTSQVENMSSMFEGCGVASLDLSTFDTSKVTLMGSLFKSCKNLTALDISSFDTSQAENMGWMFYECPIMELNLSHFDTSKVTYMGCMFSDCSNLKRLDVSSFDTSQVKSMFYMFSGSGMSELDLSHFDTSEVTDMQGMFSSCNNLMTLNISNFDTSQVEDMSGMFERCGLAELDLSHFDTSKVTDMYGMFNKCSNLKTLNICNFDTSQVDDMSHMFAGCGMTELDLSHFDTSKVEDMGYMFAGCENLKSKPQILIPQGANTIGMYQNTQWGTPWG